MNPLFKKKLPRRSFLKGGSYMVALPFLDAMIPAMTKSALAQQNAQKNFLYFYFPFGHKPLGDQSQGEQDTPWLSFTLDQNLSTLKPLFNEKKVHMMQGMNHAGNEHSAASTLTANTANQNISGVVQNESFDYFLSRNLPGAAEQRFPLFTLGVRDNGSRNDLRRHYISWRGPNQFNNKEMSAVNLYNQLFSNLGNNNLNAQTRHNLLSKKAAVDAVLEDYRKLKSTLSQEDKNKLEAYFENLRAVERRLAQYIDNTPTSRSFQYSRPNENNADTLAKMEDKAKTFIDLVMIGFASSQNQVASIMLDNAGGGLGHFADYRFSYHDAGRDAGSMHSWPARFAREHIYNVHRMLARLFKGGIERMVEYGIYNDTAFLMSSECGFHHVASDTHFLVSGGIFEPAGGTVKNYNVDVGRFYTTIGQKFGINMNSFGKARGTMTW